MGLRGPLPNPNSQRSKIKAARAARVAMQVGDAPPGPALVRIPAPAKTAAADSPETPTAPDWLSRTQKALFRSIVSDLQAAKVPVKHIDSHAIVMAVQCISGVEEAERYAQDAEASLDNKLVALRLKAQMGKDLIQWLQLICATPGARARLGLKATPEKKMGPIAQLAAAMAARRMNGS